MASGPVVAMVWEGLDAVKTGRVMLGATNPLASAPGISKYLRLRYRYFIIIFRDNSW